MKLCDIYSICKRNIDEIGKANLSYSRRKGLMLGRILKLVIVNSESVKTIELALNEVKQIKCLENDANEIYNSLRIFDRQKYEVKRSSVYEVSYELKKLINNMNLIKNLCESMNLEDNSGNLNIKIPKCRDFDEYISYIKDLNFILYQCPFLKSENEKINFKATDVGSMWLDFVIVFTGVSLIFRNLAILLEKATALKSHLVTVKQQQEILETMQQKNEIGQEVIGAFKIAEDVLIKKYVKEIEEQIGELNDGEEHEKAEKSLEKLSNLLNKGVEIYTAIDAPKEVQVLFPENTKVDGISDDIVKLLEKKDN